MHCLVLFIMVQNAVKLGKKMCSFISCFSPSLLQLAVVGQHGHRQLTALTWWGMLSSTTNSSSGRQQQDQSITTKVEAHSHTHTTHIH